MIDLYFMTHWGFSSLKLSLSFPHLLQSCGSLIAAAQPKASGIGALILVYLITLFVLLSIITHLIGKVRAGLLNQEAKVRGRDGSQGNRAYPPA